MICQQQCIAQLTSEVENQQQNKSEHGTRDACHLGAVTLHKTGGDERHWCYLLEHVCEALDHVARCKLGWQASKECQTGEAPDISMFHFCWWQPVLHCDPNLKFPSSNLKQGHFLGIAHSCGDEFTHCTIDES